MAVLVLLVARDRAHALLDLFRVEQVELSQKTFQRRQPMRVIAPPIVIAAMRPFPLSDFGDEQVAQLVEPVHPGLRHRHGAPEGAALPRRVDHQLTVWPGGTAVATRAGATDTGGVA